MRRNRIQVRRDMGVWWFLPVLVVCAGTAVGFTIPGDVGDGEIRFDAGLAETESEEISIGHRGAEGEQLATAIYFFRLPELGEGVEVRDAALWFTFLDRSGSFATNPANADIWGLGYVASPVIDPAWHLLGDSDERTGDVLGTGIGANPVVKISNDFLTGDSNDPNSDPYRMALPAPGLASFLALLYDQGAVSGDYAVIRVNVDAATSLGNRGFELASANAADPAHRPVLTINENTLLLYDPFTDGDRTNGDDPIDTDWYKISGSLNLTVADDSEGIGDGNALQVEMLSTGRRFLSGFPPVTLAEPGDFIQLSCTFRPTFVLGWVEAFRMGLVYSGGSPLVGDTTSTSDASHYEGYLVRMSTTAPGDLSSVRVPPGSFLGGATDFLSRNSDAIVVTDPTVYNLIYTITRTGPTQMTTRVELNDVVLNGMDPGTDPDPPDWVFTDSFDTIGMGAGNSNDAIDFFLDNVRVETSVSLLEIVPHVEVPAEAMELVVETQSGVRYSLQEATAVEGADWTDSGYILTGDGTSLRVYDPDAVESQKFYRMEVQP